LIVIAAARIHLYGAIAVCTASWAKQHRRLGDEITVGSVGFGGKNGGFQPLSRTGRAAGRSGGVPGCRIQPGKPEYDKEHVEPEDAEYDHQKRSER
jgi:hypothetical protein